MTTPQTEEEWNALGKECDIDSYNYHKKIYETREFSKSTLDHAKIKKNLGKLERHVDNLKTVAFNIAGILRNSLKEKTLDELTNEIVKYLRLLPDKFIGTSGLSGWIRFTSLEKLDTHAPLKKAWVIVYKEVIKSNTYTSERQDGTVYYNENENDNQFYNFAWDIARIYRDQILCETFYNDKCCDLYEFKQNCCNSRGKDSKYFKCLNDMKHALLNLFKNRNYHDYLKEAGPESWSKFMVPKRNNSEASKNISDVVESTFKEYFQIYLYN